ncbi:hypothetical protein CF327_g4631 [Tilletia walkeri]|uniref:Uncharacterized protein n=1 Tax=Tilletia walkeri TaxID=117179 RepID=A0A8X7N4E8_9BASI|nr:hypothetical protein CF327_g4631 [Tilletia walkeri]KAE8264877.1 hypothetical protein A4X09_0g6834 [Tilletia walkeri]
MVRRMGTARHHAEMGAIYVRKAAAKFPVGCRTRVESAAADGNGEQVRRGDLEGESDRKDGCQEEEDPTPDDFIDIIIDPFHGHFDPDADEHSAASDKAALEKKSETELATLSALLETAVILEQATMDLLAVRQERSWAGVDAVDIPVGRDGEREPSRYEKRDDGKDAPFSAQGDLLLLLIS